MKRFYTILKSLPLRCTFALILFFCVYSYTYANSNVPHKKEHSYSDNFESPSGNKLLRGKLNISWTRPAVYFKRHTGEKRGRFIYGLRVTDTLTFQVNVSNTDDGDLTNTVVNFKFPEGYNVIRYTVVDGAAKTTTKYSVSQNGPYDATTGIWNAGTLTKGSKNQKSLSVDVAILSTGSLVVSPPNAESVDDARGIRAAGESKFDVGRIEQFKEEENSLFLSIGYPGTELHTVDNNKINYPITLIKKYKKDLLYNAMAYNPKDRYLYAIKNSTNIQTRGEVLLIDKYGDVWDITTLRTSQAHRTAQFFAGEIDPDGNYYIRSGTGNIPTLKVDLKTFATKVVSYVKFTDNADFAWNGGHLYTVASNGYLYKIDVNAPSDRNLTTIGQLPNGIGNGRDAKGKRDAYNLMAAMYGSNDPGYIFGSKSDGKGFYRISTTADAKGMVKVFRHTGTYKTSSTDGAHDVTKSLPFPTDLGISITTAATCVSGGGTLSYTVTVGNYGATNAPDVKVMLGKWIAQAIPGFVATPTNFRYEFEKGHADNIVNTNLNDWTNPIVELVHSDENKYYEIVFRVTVDLPYTLVDDLNLAVALEIPSLVTDPEGDNRRPNSAEVQIKTSVPLNGLKISKNVMCIGDEVPTLVTTKPGRWTSLNPSVATVTFDGTITIIKEGTVSFSFLPDATPQCPPTPVELKIKPVPDPPLATVTSQPTCINPTGTITVTQPQNASNLYTYTLVGITPLTAAVSQQSQVFENLPTGKYQLTVSTTLDGCPSSGIILDILKDADQPEIPTGTASQPTCISPIGSITITSALNENEIFVLTDEEGNQTSQNVGIFENLQIGKYKVSVKDTVKNCLSSPQLFTLALPTIVADAGDIFTITCNTDPSTQRIGKPAIEGYSYSWTSSSGTFPGNKEANPLVNPSVTTTYTLIVTDDKSGCSDTASVVVTVEKNIPNFTVVKNNIAVTCANRTDFAQIGVIADESLYYFAWEVKEGLSEVDAKKALVTVNPKQTSTYTLRITDKNTGCFIDTIFEVEVSSSVPVILATATHPTCRQLTGSIEITSPKAEGKVTYTYTLTSLAEDAKRITQNTPTFSNVAPGDYTISVVRNDGCVSDEIDITVDDPPSPTKPLLTLTGGKCMGDFYSVIFSTNGIISVNHGTIEGNTIIVPKGVNLKVIVTDVTGCETNEADIIAPNCDTPPPGCILPDVSIGQPVCAGDGMYDVAINFKDGVNVKVSAGTLNYQTKKVNNIPIGQNLTVTFGDPGCDVVFEISSPKEDDCNKTDNPCIAAAFSASAGICLGDTYDVVFDPLEGATITASEGTVEDGIIRGIPMGVSVTITATFENGCPTQELVIESPAVLKPLLTVTSGQCTNNEYYTVTFATNGEISVNVGTISGNTITVPKGQNLSVVSRGAYGCSANQIDVEAPNCIDPPVNCVPPEISAGQPVCYGDGFYAVAINFASGVKITVSAGTLDLSSKHVINIPVGTNLVITAEQDGCTAEETVYPPEEDACDPKDPPCTGTAFSASAGICEGNTYNVSFVAAKNVTIASSVGTLIDGQIVGIPMGIAVTLTATFSNGCDSQELTIPSPVTTPPLLTADVGMCMGDFYTVMFTSNGIVSVNVGTINGNIIKVPKGQKLSIIAKDIYGCATSQIDINAPDCISPPTNCTPPKLSAGQGVCTGDRLYSVALNFADGVKIKTSAGVLDIDAKSVTNIPLGTKVTVTAGEVGCETSIDVNSPSEDACKPNTIPCSGAAFSASAGICLGATYDVYFVPLVGATISASAGKVGKGVLKDIPMGLAVTLVATFENGCPEQELIISSPVTTKPLLTVTADKCTSTNYTVTYATNGLVTVNVGTINGHTITVPLGEQLIVTATDLNGCASTQIVVDAPNCTPPPNTCTPPEISAGQPVCSGEGLYAVALNFTDGLNIKTSAGILNLTTKSVTNIPVGTDVRITGGEVGCETLVDVKSPSADSCLPTNPPCTETAFSASGGVCIGETYNIYFVKAAGVTVTASAGTLLDGVITNIPLTTGVTITGVFENGCATQTLTIEPPKCVLSPAISIIKTGVHQDENNNGLADIGESVTFEFMIKNIGNATLTNIDLDEKLNGTIVKKGVGPFTLVPGDSTKVFFTAVYKLTKADIRAGFIKNLAIVSGENSGTIVTDEDEINIPLIVEKNCPIEVFNTITPNGDNKNDFFRIDGIECYKQNNVKIFNRWGVLVFDVDNYNNDDKVFVGKSQGRVTFKANETLPTGVYFYIIKYRDNVDDHITHTKSGYLYLSL